MFTAPLYRYPCVPCFLYMLFSMFLITPSMAEVPSVPEFFGVYVITEKGVNHELTPVKAYLYRFFTPAPKRDTGTTLLMLHDSDVMRGLGAFNQPPQPCLLASQVTDASPITCERFLIYGHFKITEFRVAQFGPTLSLIPSNAVFVESDPKIVRSAESFSAMTTGWSINNPIFRSKDLRPNCYYVTFRDDQKFSVDPNACFLAINFGDEIFYPFIVPQIKGRLHDAIEAQKKDLASLFYDRFRDKQDGTIMDERTGLMWWQASLDDLTWPEAVAATAKSTEGTHTDWQMPSQEQLLQLREAFLENPALLTNPEPFVISVRNYWTATQARRPPDKKPTDKKWYYIVGIRHSAANEMNQVTRPMREDADVTTSVIACRNVR